MYRACKGIQDSLGFRTAGCGFRIPGTGFQYFSVELEFWIPIVSGIPDFQTPGLRIPQAKKFPDFEIRIPLHGATCRDTTHLLN